MSPIPSLDLGHNGPIVHSGAAAFGEYFGAICYKVALF